MAVRGGRATLTVNKDSRTAASSQAHEAIPLEVASAPHTPRLHCPLDTDPIWGGPPNHQLLPGWTVRHWNSPDHLGWEWNKKTMVNRGIGAPFFTSSSVLKDKVRHVNSRRLYNVTQTSWCWRCEEAVRHQKLIRSHPQILMQRNDLRRLKLAIEYQNIVIQLVCFRLKPDFFLSVFTIKSVPLKSDRHQLIAVRRGDARPVASHCPSVHFPHPIMEINRNIHTYHNVGAI